MFFPSPWMLRVGMHLHKGTCAEGDSWLPEPPFNLAPWLPFKTPLLQDDKESRVTVVRILPSQKNCVWPAWRLIQHKLLIKRSQSWEVPASALSTPRYVLRVLTQNSKTLDVTQSLFPGFCLCHILIFLSPGPWLGPTRRMSKYSHHGWTGTELPSL